jgi:hypothetical protein
MNAEQNTKPKRRWDLFIAKLLLAAVCFAVGVWAGYPIHLLFTPAFQGTSPTIAFLIFAKYFLPLAVCAGAGIGILCNRFWWGLLLGGTGGFMLRLIAYVVDRYF